MAHALVNRAKMSVSGTPGTGAITLGAAVTGFDTFANAGVGNGDTVSYFIEDGSNWEWGFGTYSSTGPTLTRTTVGRSSAGAGTAATLTSSAIVGLTALANDIKIDRQQFDASGTWTKPAGKSPDCVVLLQAWGGGGSGGRNATSIGSSSGGGGGGYSERWMKLSDLSSTETITVGAGGAARTGTNQAGAAGGNTSIGSRLTAYGGAGGAITGTPPQGGGGGGPLSAGGSPNNSSPGAPLIMFGQGATGSTYVISTVTYSRVNQVISAYMGEGATTRGSVAAGDSFNSGYTFNDPGPGFYHGGGGGNSDSPAGASSVYGGGGGGGGSNNAAGGASAMGGAGGNAGNATTGGNGTAPGGGGGGATGTSGSGAAGRAVITVFPA